MIKKMKAIRLYKKVERLLKNPPRNGKVIRLSGKAAGAFKRHLTAVNRRRAGFKLLRFKRVLGR